MAFEHIRLARLLWSNLGHCPYCIRRSFLIAAGIWLLFAGVMAFVEQHWLTWTFLALALVATSLWIAHLAVFTMKSSSERKDNDPTSSISRRELLPAFAKVFAGIAIASSLGSGVYASSDTVDRQRLEELKTLRAKKSLNPVEETEFKDLLTRFGRVKAAGTICVCDNNYACNPDSPPPNCGTCTCYNV